MREKKLSNDAKKKNKTKQKNPCYVGLPLSRGMRKNCKDIHSFGNMLRQEKLRI